jgi:hypothetical protein
MAFVYPAASTIGPSAGRGLFARQRLPEGTVIGEAQPPCALALQSKMTCETVVADDDGD